MMKQATFIWILLIFLTSGLKAQVDDEVPRDTLKETIVVDQRISSFEKEQLQSLDSLEKSLNAASNLGEMLQQTVGLNLKVYGSGGITSASLRGGQAAQTAVLWNGMNLQDPLNGGVNFSLIPSFFIDQIDVHSGGYSALFGSGAVSGSIHTGSTLKFSEGFKLSAQQQFGSFGAQQSGIDVRYSTARFLNTTKVMYRQADNDFPYINTEQFGNPMDYQKNAFEKELGIMQENAFLIAKKLRLSTHLWWLQNHHQIPSNMTISKAHQSQEDASMKALIALKYGQKGWKMNLRTALFYTSLVYKNPDLDMVSQHLSWVQKTEFDLSKSWDKKFYFDMGLSQHFVKGISGQLEHDNPSLRSAAAFVSGGWRHKNVFMMKLNIRQEERNSSFKTPSYSLSLMSGEWKGWKVWSSFSRNYRMPTFNDLYWIDAFSKGNPDLLDEHSYSSDVNATFNQDMSKGSLELTTSFFHQKLFNMMQWLPDNQGIWSPVNHQVVRSRGAETRMHFSYRKKAWKWNVKANYHFTLSTLEESAIQDEKYLGHQLIYTPLHQASGTVTIQYKGFSLSYHQAMYGKRFTHMDNTELHALPTSFISNVQAGKQFKFKTHMLHVAFKVNNVTNQSYQLVQYYPLPGIHYQLQLKYQFSQNKH